MSNTLQAVPFNVGRIYTPVHESAQERRAKDAARGRGITLVMFSYVLFGLTAVVVLPLEGKVIAAIGLLGYVLYVSQRRSSHSTDMAQPSMRRPM